MAMEAVAESHVENSRKVQEALPLLQGHVIEGRYRIGARLGGDGFVVEYEATDLRREEPVTVTELAPRGCARLPDQRIAWTGDLEPLAFRLRHLFTEEAHAASKLRLGGLYRLRDIASENATAYLVWDSWSGTRTLAERLGEGPLNLSTTLELAEDLLETLEALHRRRILHRNLGFEAIRLRTGGRAKLVRFGLAMEWLRDSLPGWDGGPGSVLAPEQLQRTAKRGPETDLFRLCWVLRRAFIGDASAAGEMARLRTATEAEAEGILLAALERGLDPVPGRRWPSAAALREAMVRKTETENFEQALESYDDKAVRLMSFRFRPRQCPACGGLLESERPLGKDQCPVCKYGRLLRRSFEPRLCPICRSGPLQRVRADTDLRFCPICHTGRLQRVRKRLLSRRFDRRCPECGAMFDPCPGGFALAVPGRNSHEFELGVTLPEAEWRKRAGRAAVVMCCEACEAQLDELPSGEWLLVVPQRTGRPVKHTPQEWARIAAGHKTGAGNAECSDCQAEFDLRRDTLTLLNAPVEAHRFAQLYLYRSLKREDARWIGIGKISHAVGLVCEKCGIEFDKAATALRLVQTDFAPLLDRVGETKSLEDWHRIAQGLPECAEEADFEADFNQALRAAYREGKVPFRSREGCRIDWIGPAKLSAEREGKRRGKPRAGKLIVDQTGIRFRGFWTRTNVPWSDVRAVAASDDEVHIGLDGRRLTLEVQPVVLSVKLRSGRRRIVLSASDLAERIRWATPPIP